MFSRINDWRLPTKMMMAFAVIGALIIALAAKSLFTSTQLNAISHTHVERGIRGQRLLADALGQIREQRIIIYSHLNAQSVDDMRGLEERFAQSQVKLNAALDGLAPLAGEFTPKLQALRDHLNALTPKRERLFAQRRSGDVQGALAFIKGPGKAGSRAAIDGAEELQQLMSARSARAEADGDAFADQALILTVLMSILSLGGLVAIWWLINQTLSKPMSALTDATTRLASGGSVAVPHRGRKDELGQIAEAVETFRAAAVARTAADARAAEEQKIVTETLEASLDSLARGDLTVEVTAAFPPAYQSLKTNFNKAVDRLGELIGAVAGGAAQIRTGSVEIAQASEDLARRTESNAASLEQTSAAMVQMDGRLKASAGSAAETAARADQTMSTVSGGRAVAAEAVSAMVRVSDSAKGIDDVIEGLDKIAFQTRVLAMNAAVEAGRAGEAGRGFAVVADLVSALAMRAEEEAKRAKDQLTATRSEISDAVEAVQKVDGALAAISGDVEQVHVLVSAMAADNRAQAAAITEVSAAVAAMDQATQQNAAMVEQTSAAARNLNAEVDNLAEQAGQFRTPGSPAAGPGRARTASRAPAYA